MKDVHKIFFSLLPPTIVGSMAAVYYGFILPVDAVLNLCFICIAWFAFGAPWEHRKWNHQNDGPTWQRVAPRLCLVATILTVAIPVVSLATGSLITKYVPQRIDGAMAQMVMRSPTEMPTTTLPRANSPEVGRYIPPRPGSFVAAGTPTDIAICAAEPVLIKVLGEMDSKLRVKPASWFAGGLLVFLFFLWVFEIALDYGNIKKS